MKAAGNPCVLQLQLVVGGLGALGSQLAVPAQRVPLHVNVAEGMGSHSKAYGTRLYLRALAETINFLPHFWSVNGTFSLFCFIMI